MILASIFLMVLQSFLIYQPSTALQKEGGDVYTEGRQGPSDNDYVIPISIKKWMVKKRSGYDDMVRKPYRRTGLPNLSSMMPSGASSYSSSQDADSLSGVFAKWNPKLNVTWPPQIPYSDATSDMPAYQVAASSYHDDHDHAHYPTMKQIQYVPIPYCHHEMHHEHHKKKEISLIWPLIFLGLLFLPLLLGALLLPLAFLFISNIIQLINLFQRLQTQQQPAAAQGTGRKKRSASNHPLIDQQIDSITNRLERSLEKFIKFLEDC